MNKFTDEQSYILLHEGGLWDETTNEETHEVVEETIVGWDDEHNSITKKIVVHDYKENKFYQTQIRISEYHPDKNIQWKEVFPEQQTITVYSSTKK